jgi:hypothetical protein
MSVQQMSFPPVADVSEMEVVDGDHTMASRLRSLGWSTTEMFHSYTIYKARDRDTRQCRVIGVTRFLPGPAECVHYVLPSHQGDND